MTTPVEVPEGGALFVTESGQVAVRHADGTVEPLAEQVVETVEAGETTVEIAGPEQQQPHPVPCADCKREHLKGEHVVYTVPRLPTEDDPSAERTAWEGCVDCWVLRTSRTSDLATPTYVHRLLDVMLDNQGGLLRLDGVEVPHDVMDRLLKYDEARKARESGAPRRQRRQATRQGVKARTKPVTETTAEARS
jgi:hypothetical protein